MKHSKQLSLWSFGACAMTLAAQVASAATVPVEYTVDAKDLKKNAPAGTMITIELHGNAACTSLIATQTVDIESLPVIDAVKSAKISGGAKRANFARLHSSFANVNPLADTDLFVKITAATGITPVGGACQLQEPLGVPATGVVGPTGATGPTGPSGE
jgi:hypothetical protein